MYSFQSRYINIAFISHKREDDQWTKMTSEENVTQLKFRLVKKVELFPPFHLRNLRYLLKTKVFAKICQFGMYSVLFRKNYIFRWYFPIDVQCRIRPKNGSF